MRNAEAVKRLGNSLLLDKSELYDVDVLEASIREILDNERFQNNASVLSKMIKNRPRDLKAELVNYVKFAAEFGSPQEFRFPHSLRSPLSNITCSTSLCL
ncbi:hypothetical protein L596_026016 [Steinernema carpocapsae]|uniref:glucuronosyltransferase n=1 Tax=Steinernema carpocapsae TaxID=34508 RepID=A0A4U5M130_STECR|nr:hypothetical protein L596_026016 [Steinernema carpocapsae]